MNAEHNFRINIHDGFIVIGHGLGNDDGLFEYRIPVRECSGYEAILKWVLQLSEKTWCSPRLLRGFIMTAMGENDLRYPSS